MLKESKRARGVEKIYKLGLPQNGFFTIDENSQYNASKGRNHVICGTKKLIHLLVDIEAEEKDGDAREEDLTFDVDRRPDDENWIQIGLPHDCWWNA